MGYTRCYMKRSSTGIKCLPDPMTHVAQLVKINPPRCSRAECPPATPLSIFGKSLPTFSGTPSVRLFPKPGNPIESQQEACKEGIDKLAVVRRDPMVRIV